MAGQSEIAESEGLTEQLGFWHLWAIGVGSVVADGIFLALGAGIASAGPAAIVAYVLAGLFMLSIALTVSDLAVGLPSAGAMWIWGREILGDYAGFVAGITFASGWIIAGGSVGLATGRIFQFFTPNWGIPAAVWGIVFITLLTLIQLGGVFLSSRLQLATVLVFVGIIIVFGMSTLLSGNFSTERFVPFVPKGLGNVWAAVAFGMYAYLGPLTLTTAGDETKNAVDIPRALVVATATIIVIYTVAMIGMIGLVDWQRFSVLQSPFTTTAKIVWGPVAAYIINLAAFLAALTSLFMGTLYSAPRLLYKMGEMKVLPDIFGQVYGRTQVPLFATVFVWAISVILLLGGAFGLINYSILSLLLTFSWLVTWGVTIVAAIKYRQEYSEYINRQDWTQPAFPLFPILGTVGLVVVMYGTFRTAFLAFGLGVILLIAISIIYAFYQRFGVWISTNHQFCYRSAQGSR